MSTNTFSTSHLGTDTGVRRPLIEARGLVKRYGRVTALDHADFDLYPGEIDRKSVV